MNKKDIQTLGTLYESGLSRLWDKTQRHTCGAITAFRGEKTNKVNKQNNQKLLVYLQSKGYSVTKIDGSYIENYRDDEQKEEDLARQSGGEYMNIDPEIHVDESSFFVCNQKVEGDDGGELESVLVKMGEHFDQDSIMVIPFGGKGAYLVGTTRRENWLPYGETSPVGNGKWGKKSGQFYSKIKGREFAFEEYQLPQTYFGKMGASKLLNEFKKELR